jgi:WD40 repeat protein
LRTIGSGAYGEVWLARNVLGALRAVKVVYRASFDSDRPYHREFDGIQRVEPISRAHPGHVPILQAGRNDPEGYFYYVMELADDAGTQPGSPEWNPVAGRFHETSPSSVESYVPHTLKEHLKRHGHLEFDECLRLALALASGLDYLHQHGLVHRDIKPSNIIFVDGAPKFTDIGLVTIADATCSAVGTEGYLPPEGPGSAPADLFSLGKVLYEAATGMDRRHYPELPPNWPPLPEADRWLEINAIVLKACKRDPRERYQSAAQIHADLLLLQSGKSVRRTHLLEQRLAGFYRVAAVLVSITALASSAYLWASFQMRRAEENLHRAELSEAGMREQLRESLLHQARALRLSRLPGQRLDALTALGRAGAIRTGPDLLTEVVHCLGLTDVRPIHHWAGVGLGRSDHTLDLRLDRVAISDANGAFSIRTISDGTEITRLPGPGLPCMLAIFSPDGRYFAAKHHVPDREALNRTFTWDLQSNSAPFEFPEPVTLRSIAFSPDSRTVAVATRPDLVTLYELPGRIQTLRFPTGLDPYALSYSPDGSQLAIASLDGSVQIRHSVDGRLLSSLDHPVAARAIAWHPDGRRLAVPCDDWLVHLWDIQTERRVALFAGHKAQVVTARFSHDGKLLATISWDKTLGLWDVDRAQHLLSYPISGGTRFADFNPDDSRLARFGDGINAELLEILRPAQLYSATGFRSAPLPPADLGPDGQSIAFATRQGVRLHSFNPTSDHMILPVPAVTSVRFLPDGRLLSTSENRLFVHTPSEGSPQLAPPFPLWTNRLTASLDILAVATQTNRAILRTDPNTVTLLYIDSSSAPVVHLPHPQVASAAISATGRWAATTGAPDGDVMVWDASSGTILKRWTNLGPTRVLFTPDADQLILSSRSACLIVETLSWNTLHRIPPPNSPAISANPLLALSNDGTLLAINWIPDQVSLLLLPQGRPLLTLEALGQSPLWFNPDSTALYVQGQYSEIYQWDLLTLRKELASIGLDWHTSPSTQTITRNVQ